jgi:hypothetical protein
MSMDTEPINVSIQKEIKHNNLAGAVEGESGMRRQQAASGGTHQVIIAAITWFRKDTWNAWVDGRQDKAILLST